MGSWDAAERASRRRLGVLGGDDRGGLRLQLARARVVRGELDRAAAPAARGFERRGHWRNRAGSHSIAGTCAVRPTAFRSAGPYAGERAAATERTAMLALVAAESAPDTLPELGAALLTLARGDSAGAITALRRVASQLEPAGGRADLLLLAGQVARGLGGLQDSTAARLFEQAAREGGRAPPLRQRSSNGRDCLCARAVRPRPHSGSNI